MNHRMEDLVREGAVHRRVYADPELFEIEHRRLFRRTWLYVGHESQAPAPGDWFTTELAREPVIVVRGADGVLRGFFNRCSHRGALVARRPSGSGKRLECAYHGWTFQLDGALEAIPAREGYAGTEVNDAPQRFGLQPLPRFASYRGFLFASLAADGPDLETFLGPVAVNLDTMVDRSPSGRIAVWGTKIQLIKRNNWKVYLENLHDGAHALPTHASSIRPARVAADDTDSEWTRLAAYIVGANSQPPSAMLATSVNCFPNGHSEMMAFRKTRPDSPGQREYEAALAERIGRDGVEQVLAVDRQNAIVYPTLTVQANWEQLRLIVPLDVNTTRVDIWVFRMVDAPEWINRRILAYTNTIHTPMSLVRADDLENFERTQRGLAAESVEWVSMHRQMQAEPGGQGASSAMSDRYMRNQYAAWLDYMSAGESGASAAARGLRLAEGGR